MPVQDRMDRHVRIVDNLWLPRALGLAMPLVSVGVPPFPMESISSQEPDNLQNQSL